jgi:hypothetical protein
MSAERPESPFCRIPPKPKKNTTSKPWEQESLTVFLIGTKSNRDGTGASLKSTFEGFAQVEQAKGGMGYMSASDPRIHSGLGNRTKVESLEITWPSGQLDRLTNVPIDQIIAVKEGVGIVPRRFPKFVGPK